MWKKYILMIIAILAAELVLAYFMTFYGVRIYDTMYILAGASGMCMLACLAGGIVDNIYTVIRKPKIEE